MLGVVKQMSAFDEVVMCIPIVLSVDIPTRMAHRLQLDWDRVAGLAIWTSLGQHSRKARYCCEARGYEPYPRLQGARQLLRGGLQLLVHELLRQGLRLVGHLRRRRHQLVRVLPRRVRALRGVESEVVGCESVPRSGFKLGSNNRCMDGSALTDEGSLVLGPAQGANGSWTTLKIKIRDGSRLHTNAFGTALRKQTANQNSRLKTYMSQTYTTSA